MQYFTVQARTHIEAVDKMKSQYGSTARILSHRSVRMGGLAGFFGRQGVEITGYVSAGGRREPAQNVEVEKKKILDGVRRDQTIQQILDEIKTLKRDIGNGSSAQQPAAHPALAAVRDLLLANDFPHGFVEKTVAHVTRRLSLDELENQGQVVSEVVDYIGQGLRIYRPAETTVKPRIITVVGPTGVGKTTTIAKLAAMFGFARDGEMARRVRMVTIDNYKIAARKQIETYADIMQIPASFAESRSDLAKVISLSQDVDIILVDTIGKSPGDYDKLGEIKDILGACGSRNEIHLAISATTKPSDVEEILHQFEPFKYRAIVLTKLDETTTLGNVIGPLIEARKPLSYLTDGQLVPQDIERASMGRLITSLDGFPLDRDGLEERYGESETVRRVWSS